MLTPTDKAAIEGLIELASKLEKQLDDGDGAYPDDYHEVCHKAFDALPALQRLLSGETREDIRRARWNGDGEPYFVIRGKDKFALTAISSWLDAARKFDAEETERTGFVSEPLRACIKSAHNVWDSIMSWQANFGVKVPDLPDKPSPIKFAKNKHRTSDFGKEHLKHVNPDGTDKESPSPHDDAGAVDVKGAARELAESIDFTDDRAKAKEVFEKILPAVLRRHTHAPQTAAPATQEDEP